MNESKLINFLDSKNNFSLQYLEGQKLVHDLVLNSGVKGKGLQFFRDIILTAVGVSAFLKDGESAGIYIDSEYPYFRFKIEISSSGQMRTLLLPDNFEDFPEKITGRARLTKSFIHAMSKSYTSIIEINNLSTNEVINKIFKDSYQIESKIIVSDESDESIMLVKLPEIGGSNIKSNITLNEYELKNKIHFNSIFKKAYNNSLLIKDDFEKLSYEYLGEKRIIFKCTCSKERMILNIKNMSNASTEDLFEVGKDKIEIKCDYCKSLYYVSKDEINN